MTWLNSVFSSIGKAVDNVVGDIKDAGENFIENIDDMFIDGDQAASESTSVTLSSQTKSLEKSADVAKSDSSDSTESTSFWGKVGGFFKGIGEGIGGAAKTIGSAIGNVATWVNTNVIQPVGDTIGKGWEAIKANPVLGVLAVGAAIAVGAALWPVTTVVAGTGVAGLAAGTAVTGTTAAVMTAAGTAVTTGSIGGAIFGALGTALGLTGLFGLGSSGESSGDKSAAVAVAGDGILTEADLQLNINGLSDADAASIIQLLKDKGYIDESGNILKWPDNSSDLSDITDNESYQQVLFTILSSQKPTTEAA